MGYYFSCGESPWEGKLEGENNIEANDDCEELESINNSQTQEMVRQPYFHHIFFHYQALMTI